MVSGYNDNVARSNTRHAGQASYAGKAPSREAPSAEGAPSAPPDEALSTRHLALTFVRSVLLSGAIVVVVLGAIELLSDAPAADPSSAASEQGKNQH